jgi:uncharacterized surface protein with fasciclin (FAS1) repeats
MNSKNIKHIVMAALVGCGLAAATTACTDTWDDHYEGSASGVSGSSLWSAIQSNPDLSNFRSVVEACGYDKRLASSQVFTVFAPVNDQFSAAEAQALITQYKTVAATGVRDDDNPVVKEFLQNHIALYNHSVSQALSDSSIVMMNGKYQKLGYSVFGTTQLLTRSQPYANGLLYTIDKRATFFPNVFEYLEKDAELDSVRSFLYNPLHYQLEFQEEESVEGGLDSLGRTVYLDSVFRQKNELFSILNARINSEDSTYWMLAPTNTEWKRMVDEYTNYFVYEPAVKDMLLEGTPDSLVYTNVRLAIIEGAFFSRTTNTDRMLNDSAMSTACVLNYSTRRAFWGADSLHYYQYMKPLEQPDGVLTGTTDMDCSNGVVKKTSDWKIRPTETFMRERILECEDIVRERGKAKRGTDSIETTTPVFVNVTPDNPHYSEISGHSFVEFSQEISTVNHNVTFNLTNILSNVPYDIYIVAVPVSARDTTVVGNECAPVKIRFQLAYHLADGTPKTEKTTKDVTTERDSVQWLKVADGFTFPVCTYGVSEAEPQATLKVETRASSTNVNNGDLTRTMRFDCIVLKPRYDLIPATE